MDTKRQCAALTVPSVLPREGHQPNDELPRPYQSVGADGIGTLTGKALIALVPPGVPWWEHAVSARLRAEIKDDAASQGALEAALYLRDLAILNRLEATNYRTRMRTVIEHLLIVGNCLVKMTDDLTFRGYRMDRWVRRRGSDGRTLFRITWERPHYTELQPAQIEAAELDPAKLEAAGIDQQFLDLYTKCERSGSGWMMTQEINGHTVFTESYSVDPYIDAGYIECLDEDYSRSFIEDRLPDLRSVNSHSKALLDAAAAASKVQPVIDLETSQGMRASDLKKDSGVVLTGRVVNGVVQGVGFVKLDKYPDMQFSLAVHEMISKRLSAQMLRETASQPQGERVTAYQVSRIAQEIDSALGGVYAHIAEEIQKPLIAWVVRCMTNSGELKPLVAPLDKEIHVNVLTGIEAMRRQGVVDRINSVLERLAPLPEAQRRVRWSAVVQDAFAAASLNTQRYLKTDDEMEADVQQQIAAQTQMMQNQQAIQTAGRMAENQA